MTIQLKPCPFCGGTDLHYQSRTIECNACLAEGPYCDSGELAAVAWNKRASGWISISEELPKKSGFYICAPYVTGDGLTGSTYQWFFANKEHFGQLNHPHKHVTHWMYPPNLPVSLEDA